MTLEWWATGIAVIAALAAIWQAWEARRSRRAADKSAVDAADHESRAVAAAERMAAAIEEQTVAAREDRQKYEVPWSLSTAYMKSAKAWDLRLGGSEVVRGISLVFEPENANVDTLAPAKDSMRPGESIRLYRVATFGTSVEATMTLRWTRPNGNSHEVVETLR